MPSVTNHLNVQLEKGDWTKSIIWDVRLPHKSFSRVNLNLNDPNMLLQVTPFGNAASANADQAPSETVRHPGLDRFNLSNDREYEETGETKKVIRQTFGLLEVAHSYPAQKLQLPFVRFRAHLLHLFPLIASLSTNCV